MSPKLPVLTGREVARLIEDHGFFFVSQKGSHAKYRNSEGRTTIIPMHGTERNRSWFTVANIERCRNRPERIKAMI